MDERVYQILYCSRNNIRGTEAEIKAQIDAILRASRVNNGKVEVTGALFHNTVFFAQVLEGRFDEVQRVFERLQLDPRHSDLVVLRSGYVAARDFAEWSMAFAGTSADLASPVTGIAATHSANGDQVLSFLREVVVMQENWALPERSSAVRPMSTRTALAAAL